MGSTMKLLCMFLVLSVFLSADAISAQMHVDSNKFKDFLINDYSTEKEDLIVFKDPRCPYCSKAFKQLETLENYNVFIFWSPILGSTSERQVESFFKCSEPMGNEIIHAVANRQQVHCDGEFNETLWNINSEMVQDYAPKSVPQYWLGDQKVWVTQLHLTLTHEQRIQRIAQDSQLALPWKRYAQHLASSYVSDKLHLAIVTAKDDRASLELQKKLGDKYNLYVFNSEDTKESANEFKLLTGIENVSEDIFLLEGKRLSKHELSYLEL